MGDLLKQVDLPARRMKVCLMRIGGRQQRHIARRLRMSQPTVSRELAAAVRRYPSLAPLLYPAQGRHRPQVAA
jgi:hypothetical protein